MNEKNRKTKILDDDDDNDEDQDEVEKSTVPPIPEKQHGILLIFILLY